MNRVHRDMPLISIVVPVYNAEAYLGYCLNSLMSQTYVNFEVIMIDDGSTDNSLEICQNYVDLDERFTVNSIPNGGVSHARNIGVELSRGEYLFFQDSDDVITPDALQTLLDLEKTYKTGFVVGDVQQYDFSQKCELVKLSADWTNGKKHFSKEEFKAYKMQLIWFTALLEGPYAKLYDAAIWKDESIRFPEELSLGEDFVANMKFFEKCNGVVFANQVVHFYNNSVNSESLTQKYRPDLFENKMLLMQHLANHLGEFSELNPTERDCFYDYVVSNGFAAIKKTLLDGKNVPEDQMVLMIRDILNHSLFRESLDQAEYINAEFAEWVPLINEGNAYALLKYEKEKNQKRTAAFDRGEETEKVKDPRSMPNKILGKCLWVFGKLLKGSKLGQEISRFERNLFQYGIKNTWNMYSTSARIKRFIDIKLECAVRELANDIKASKEHIENYVETTRKCIENRIEEERKLAENRIEEERKRVEEYTYLVEQRIKADLYRDRVNELRQRKKAIIVGSAEHCNIGDAAITLAEQSVLLKQYPEYFQMEFSTYEIDRQYDFLQAIMNSQDIIFLNGGGNLGDRYIVEENLRRRIISDFPEHKIVILPQTISFSETPQGEEELTCSKRIYNAHRNLTIFTRGKRSFEFAKKHFIYARIEIMPDMAFALKRSYCFEREGILLCLRDDIEGVVSEYDKDRVRAIAFAHSSKVNEVTNMAPKDVSREIRASIVNEELKRHASSRCVITDRLHGMIFAAITDTPVIVLKSVDHKIEEFYEEFFADSNSVFYIGDQLDQLDEVIKRAMDVEKPECLVFEKQQLAQMSRILKS